MIAAKVFSIVFPVFFLIGLGYLFGRLKKIDLGALTEVIIYVASPALTFSALAKSDLSPRMMGFIPLAAILIILGMWLLSAVFLRFFREDLRGLYLPIMFPNARKHEPAALPVRFWRAGAGACRHLLRDKCYHPLHPWYSDCQPGGQERL